MATGSRHIGAQTLSSRTSVRVCGQGNVHALKTSECGSDVTAHHEIAEARVSVNKDMRRQNDATK